MNRRGTRERVRGKEERTDIEMTDKGEEREIK